MPNLVEFLDGIGMAQFAASFQAEDIDMSVLPLLEQADLVELGLSLGQRKRLQSAIRRLERPRLEHSGEETPRRPGLREENRIELRRMSVMFCDIVGSTDLGERLSIDGMQSVLGHYYAVARRIGEAHGGYIPAVQGDGIIMLFGYPRAFDGTAARCVQAAIALQDALAEEPVRVSSQETLFIPTRVGVATGKAAVGQADGSVPGGGMHLVGPVVNRAARLQTFAKQLSIVVDARTREQTEPYFSFSQPEMVHLKGLQQDVPVSRVLGHRSQHPDDGSSPVPLIGRDGALAALADLWASVRAGTPGFATITGDAGIGKTALLAAFLARLGPDDAGDVDVMRLHGSPLAEQNALRPVAEYLADPANTAKAAELREILDRSEDELAHSTAGYLGFAGHTNGSGRASKGARGAMLELLSGWITRTGGAPRVLVLENAHLADHTTRELMAACADTLLDAPAPMLMLALSRDEDEDIWGDAAPTRRIALEVLDDTAAEALLDRVIEARSLPLSLQKKILRHSGGNPLMIETLGNTHEAWRAADLGGEIDVPFTIYESVSKRLDEIDSGHHAIEALSVLNGPTDLQTLALVMDRPEVDLPKALDALLRAGLVTRDAGEIRIRHQVYRDVIYEKITGKSREKLHRAAYAALRRQDETIAATRPDILAQHARAAQDHRNAAIHALEAGERLLSRSALIEASHFFNLAVTTLEGQPDDDETNRKRLRAVTGQASVERSRFGIATDASGALGQEAARLARGLGDDQAELLALNGLYSHALVRADYPLAQDYAERLLEAARQSRNETFGMVATRAIGVVALHRGDYATALSRLETALAQYDRETHLPLTHAHGYDHAEICSAFLSYAHWLSGDPVAARRISDFSVAHSREIDHAHSLGQAMAFRVMLGALARDEDGLVAVGAELVELGDRYDLRVMGAAGWFFPFATRLCLREAPPEPGELAEVETRRDAFLRVNPFNYGPLTATVFAEVALRAGRTGLALAALETGREVERRTGETWTSPEVERLQALCLARQGQAEAAAALRREALARAEAGGAAMFALRIACDMAEADPGADAAARVEACLSRIRSDDDGWDLRRARNLTRT